MGVLVWKRGVFRRIVGTFIFWGTETALGQRFHLGDKLITAREFNAHVRPAYTKYARLQKSGVYAVRCPTRTRTQWSILWPLAYLCARAWADPICSLETRSVCAPLLRCLNSESALVWAQLILKGNGRRDSDWFIAHYAQKTRITH